jgi:hypothetical protein
LESGGVKIEFDKAMPVRYKSRILKILKEKGFDLSLSKTNARSLAQKVSDILGTYINDGEIRRYVDYELFNRSLTKDYGLY